LQGYSDNPIDPLSGTRKSLMQFDPTRLKAGPNGGQMYFPANGQGQPYVYIHNTGYATAFYDGVSPGKGKAVAYKSATTGTPYMNADTFQIISAGLDGDYGTNVVATPPVFPTAAGGNKDNITNFSGGTLASQVK
jgi:hypothetical protein